MHRNLHSIFASLHRRLGNVFSRLWLLAAALLLSVQPAQAQNAQTVRIGLIGSFSGMGASQALVDNMRNAVLMAVDERNSFTGGILGKRIELIERDDKADPATAFATARALASEGVVAILAIQPSAVAEVSQGAFQKAKVPVMQLLATSDRITAEFAPPNAPTNYVFRVGINDGVQIRFLINEMLDQKKFSRIGVMYDKSPSSVAAHTLLEAQLKARSMSLGFSEQFEAENAADIRDVMLRAKAANLDALLVWSDASGSALAVASRNEAKMRAPVYLNWSLSLPSANPVAKSAPGDVVFVQTFIPGAIILRRNEFVNAVSRRFGKTALAATMAQAQAYDGAHLLLQAIQQATTTLRPDSVRQALETLHTPWRGVVSMYRSPFNAKKHEAIDLEDLVAARYKGNEIVYLEPEEERRILLDKDTRTALADHPGNLQTTSK